MFSVVLNRTQNYSENGLDFLHVSYFISVLLEFIFNMLTHWQLFTIPKKSKFPFQYFCITLRYIWPGWWLDSCSRRWLRAGSPVVTRTKLHNHQGPQCLQAYLTFIWNLPTEACHPLIELNKSIYCLTVSWSNIPLLPIWSDHRFFSQFLTPPLGSLQSWESVFSATSLMCGPARHCPEDWVQLTNAGLSSMRLMC